MRISSSFTTKYFSVSITITFHCESKFVGNQKLLFFLKINIFLIKIPFHINQENK